MVLVTTILITRMRAKGIAVTNTPKVSTEATAELTFALLLAAARRIPEGDTLCRTTGFNGWAPLFFLRTKSMVRQSEL